MAKNGKTKGDGPAPKIPDIERLQTGIPGMDELIEGGIPRTSMVLLSGRSGTGRNTFAVQYLYHGASERDEPGVYISLEKEPEEIIDAMNRFGWDIKGLMKEKKLAIVKPEIQRFDTLKKVIEDHVDRIGAKRLVISPFSLLSAYFENTYAARKALSELSILVKKLGCTALAVTDIKEGDIVYSSTGFEEFVAGGVIALDLMFKKDSSSYVRTVFIRKMEKTNHSLKLVPIEITADGIKAYPDAEVF
jgi:KaiC/GvpD/RAD55 family RecA-like ATPase